jgi:hypothetical protein
MMIIPIFINCDDLPDLDFDGFGEFFLAYIITYVGMVPLTYSVVGMLNGFDAWGIKTLSCILGMFVALLVLIIGEFVVDFINERRK